MPVEGEEDLGQLVLQPRQLHLFFRQERVGDQGEGPRDQNREDPGQGAAFDHRVEDRRETGADPIRPFLALVASVGGLEPEPFEEVLLGCVARPWRLALLKVPADHRLRGAP